MDQERNYILRTLACYWPNNAQPILNLPIPHIKYEHLQSFPPQVQFINLPQWSAEIGVNGQMLIPQQAITPGEGPAWCRTDWFSVAFWYLNGLAERTFESQYGPIHSYSFRLKGWSSSLWEYAWVNRIALFLRRWASRLQEADEEILLGPLPKTKISVTHDVDTISKTIAIRLKQSAFHTFNSFKYLQNKNLSGTFQKLRKANQILLSRDNYWCFEQIIQLEEAYNQRSCFYIYGGLTGWRRHPQQILIDPAYKANHPKLKELIRWLHKEGWEIGLHQSFNAWANPALMTQELERVEEALGTTITTCRQHWLRFSWLHTWQAQQDVGLRLDSTLGFNDRSAFRNGAALQFNPWDFEKRQPMTIEARPMVLMDSHLYDYREYTDDERQAELSRWFDEIRFVGGIATVIWHQRVMSRDYGWGEGFKQVLENI